MRQLGKKQEKKNANEVFVDMMDGIRRMVELVGERVKLATIEYENDADVYNYVMKNENGLVKIGISKDVDIRQNTLAYAGGYEIVDIYYIKSKRKAHIVENELHKHFSKQRKLGEWFYLSFDEAVEMTNVFAKKDCVYLEDKNEDKDERILNSLEFLCTMGENCDDILDYYVMFLVLEKENYESVKELLDIYVNKYIENGDEAYNLFSLFLLLQLENKYNIKNVTFKNGNECSRMGHTVYLYDKDIEFCECLDWFQTVYEIQNR